MKKLTALVALALLAIAGTGFAVTCAQDNVPAATLLVPYFRVGGAGVIGTGSNMGDIPDTSGTDTLVAVTNVSQSRIILHVTVWNKYSAPVVDFNVPMTGYDVVFWSMRDILNGKLVVNPTFQKLTLGIDPCGQNTNNGTWAATSYIKGVPGAIDKQLAISAYQTPAFSGLFRQQVWTSLDESGDITSWTSPGSIGGGVLDANNFMCSYGDPGNTIAGDFSGYVTIDVSDYCSIQFPDSPNYYTSKAIAGMLAGVWGGYYGPNVIMGDVFYKDQKPGDTTANIGNISGDPTVSLEFDTRLQNNGGGGNNTFYGRYSNGILGPNDGREPLAKNYGFRYLQTAAPTTLRTWATIWRSDIYPGDENVVQGNYNLCNWWGFMVGLNADLALGFTKADHQVGTIVWDNDENGVSTSGCPSPCRQLTGNVFLETQRLVITPNSQIVPSTFLGGWINMTFPGTFDAQAYVGVQHSGLGLAMSVGHSATVLNGQFICNPAPAVTFTNPPLSGPGAVDGHAAVQTN